MFLVECVDEKGEKLLKNQHDPETLKVPDLLAMLAEKDQKLADTQHVSTMGALFLYKLAAALMIKIRENVMKPVR